MIKLYGGYKMPKMDTNISQFDPIALDKYNRQIIESMARVQQREHAPEMARIRGLKKGLAGSLMHISPAGISRPIKPSDILSVRKKPKSASSSSSPKALLTIKLPSNGFINGYRIPTTQIKAFVEKLEEISLDIDKYKTEFQLLDNDYKSGYKSVTNRKKLEKSMETVQKRINRAEEALKIIIDGINYNNTQLLVAIYASSVLPHSVSERIQYKERQEHEGEAGMRPLLGPHRPSASASASVLMDPDEEFALLRSLKSGIPSEAFIKPEPEPVVEDDLDELIGLLFGDGRGFRHLRPRNKKVSRVKKVKGGIFNPFTAVVNRAKSTAKSLFSSEGRNDLPPSVRTILAQHGDEPVQSMIIVRTPLGKLLSGVLNVASLGQMGKLPYDKLFHLYLLVTLPSGQYAVEKEAVVSIKKAGSARAGAEEMPIYSFPPMTLNSMMDNTRNYMSPNKFINYSAYDNNCQTFVSSVLLSNNINDSNYQNFIKQDTGSVFSSNPYFRKLANTVTDLGAKINVLQEGGKRRSKVVQKMVKKVKEPLNSVRKPKSLSELIASGAC